MKFLVTAVAVLTTAFLATGAWAEYGVVPAHPGSAVPIAPPSPITTSLMDAWNDGATPTTGWSYAASCFGFEYIPSQTYFLTRIEFIGGGNGMVTVEVRADDGGGCPTGTVLATVSYMEYSDRTWQGGDLPNCVYVEEGHSYFIKYYIIVDGLLSATDYGTIYPHCWSWDCAGWEGPSGSFAWMARFYGQFEPTATEPGTWSSLKALYR